MSELEVDGLELEDYAASFIEQEVGYRDFKRNWAEFVKDGSADTRIANWISNYRHKISAEELRDEVDRLCKKEGRWCG